MPAYLIFKISADDPARLKPYQEAAPPIIAKYKGKFIVRGGAAETLEGPEDRRRTVIIEFPGMTEAKAYYHSPEYAEAKKLREGIGRFDVMIVDGFK
jgi:uncharacterized protein (DUF1330 family)